MFCGTNNILKCIPHIQSECGEYPGIFCGILSVPHNIAVDMNNIMLPITSYILAWQASSYRKLR